MYNLDYHTAFSNISHIPLCGHRTTEYGWWLQEESDPLTLLSHPFPHTYATGNRFDITILPVDIPANVHKLHNMPIYSRYIL